MKSFRVFRVFRRHSCRDYIAALLCGVLLLQSATAVAPGPAWWGTQNVTDPAAAPDDFAVANAGQLKHLARKAMQAMDAELPGGAGAAIHALVDPWGNTQETASKADNGLAINQGQLKHVATPFYQRLGLPYPWAGASAATDNYALVNLGQLKHVFSFALKFRTLGQGPVTIPEATLQAALDAWNALPAKPLGSTLDDLDGDGIPNLQEYLMGHALFNPDDLDGDRIADSIEEASGGVLSKLNFADAVWDKEAGGAAACYDLDGNVFYQGDGVMNYEEVLLLGLDPAASTTDTRTDGLTDVEVLVWTLNAGAPLALNADPLRTFWEGIDTEWLGTNVGISYSSSFAAWRNEEDLNGNQIPDGLEAFRTEVLDMLVWWPQSPGVSEIEFPGLAYDQGSLIDMDGDGAIDTDRDYDGLPDLWEYRYELNLRVDDADEDPDNDDLSNEQEYLYGTNPRLADSDGDGFDDGAEVAQMTQGADPLDGWAGLPLTLGRISTSTLYVGTNATSAPLTVRVTQGGQPVAGVPVVFSVSYGGGLLQRGSAAGGVQVSFDTDSNGLASVVYLAEDLAGRAEVTVALSGVETESVTFTLNILAGLGTTLDGGSSAIRPWGGEAAPQAPPSDADGDGIPDQWEVDHGLDPLYANADNDDDWDGISNADEYRYGGDPRDFNSRPLPVIEMRQKAYNGRYDQYIREDGTGTLVSMFYGEAHLLGGETYVRVSGFEDSVPITNSSDRTQEMRSAFENGGYEGVDVGSGWLSVFSNSSATGPLPYPWSTAYILGDPSTSDWSKAVNGWAMELRLSDPTFGTSFEGSWSQHYLVVEYSGANNQYPTFTELPLSAILGSLKFSWMIDPATGETTKSVTFSGNAAGQVKVSGNDRVEIIPREEMGQAIKITLCPIEFLAPDVPEQPMDLETNFFSEDPIAAGAGDTSTGTLSAEKAVEIADDKFKRVEELQVAKLTGAFIPDSTNKEFILDSRYDPDAFRIVVRGLPYDPAMRLTVNLETTGIPAQGHFASIKDDATEIPMFFTSNVYSTYRQLLVAHKEDDDYPANRNILAKDAHQLFGLDEIGQKDPDVTKPSDRTHRAALGSTIRVSAINVYGVPNSGPHPLSTVSLPVNSRRSVSVSVFAFPDSGVVANGKIASRVWSDLQTARDILAQIGIQLELEQEPQVIELPTELEDSVVDAYQFPRQFNLPDGRLAAIARNRGIPSENGKILIKKCGTPNSKFTLIYCQKLNLEGDATSVGYGGYAYPPSMANDENKPYANHAFVSGGIDTAQLTLAHELCHLLTNLSHFGPGESYAKSASGVRTFNNLMRNGKPDYAPGIGKGCRLEALQQVLIDKVLDSIK